MEKKIKLTSVNIITEVYKKFKVDTVNSDINLQKLVNRALNLYETDESFKEKINNHNGLSQHGTKF
jgi:hypothetical protein